MAEQNLSFNIITFQHPEEQKLFQFVTEKKEGFYPLRNYKLPANVLDQYLLCNNSRYSDIDNSTVDGFHLPIKIKLSCSEPEQLNDEVAQELIDQIYQFSRIYWKALKQQNLPVTIKYPEMVAQIAPHFKDGIIPDYGKDNLWFL